jgi:hypothetical protein
LELEVGEGTWEVQGALPVELAVSHLTFVVPGSESETAHRLQD